MTAFQVDEQHKDAAMEFTIVMATFPVDGDPVAYLHSTHDADEDLRSLDPDLYDQLRLHRHHGLRYLMPVAGDVRAT